MSTPSTRLRPATTEDLPAILRQERDYMRVLEPESSAGWLDAMDQNLALWIACLPTTLVLELPGPAGPDLAGYVMWEVDGASATLVSIQVAERHRRAGHGSTLLTAFEQEAAAAGAQVLRLGVHRRNPARALYERSGYAAAGQEGDYLLFERRSELPTVRRR